MFDANQRKAAKNAESAQKNAQEEAARAEQEAKKLEAAKAVQLEKPDSPAASIKIKQAVAHRDQRVSVKGWVHRLRNQGGLIFVVLRDGYGFLQCVLGGKLVSIPYLLSLLSKHALQARAHAPSLPLSRPKRLMP